MFTPFTMVYFAVIISVAYFANIVSGRWPKSGGKFVINLPDGRIPGFFSIDEAEKHIKKTGITASHKITEEVFREEKDGD
jgi:hypothetical protein